jgi:hypothetical protein
MLALGCLIPLVTFVAGAALGSYLGGLHGGYWGAGLGFGIGLLIAIAAWVILQRALARK